jgi:predicted AAA+ superfamily ATPase
MIIQEIERKTNDFRSIGIPQYIHRSTKIHMADRMISTILGSRRAGKSFRLLQVADEFLQNQKIQSINNVCYLDFDNPVLRQLKASELSLIQTTFLKITPSVHLQSPCLFLFDEIHNIPGWEEYLIDLSRNSAWKVVITGSSAKMLRNDIASSLRGKAISTDLYPLSFEEFLSFNNFEHPVNSTKGKAEVIRLFDEYMKWGSFPAMISTELFSRETLLREYFDTMLLKDILQRYNVSKPDQCIRLYRYLISQMSRPITLTSAYTFLKSANYMTSRDSVREYISHAVDSLLMFEVPILSSSQNEIERNPRKMYVIDWALGHANSQAWDGFHSQGFENMVFIHLKRKWTKVNYYLTKNSRQEVDFIASGVDGKPEIAVQACISVNDPVTLKRELDPLITAAKHLGIKECYIITKNEEREIDENGVHIEILPAWKWLLQNK